MLRLDDPEQAQPRRYWGLTYLAESDRGESRWQEEFEEELGRAVRMRLMSDVPLGLFLSGGLDSTTVAAEAARAAAKPLRSFSIGFADPRYDESAWADQAAARLPTEHHRRIVSPSDLLDGAEAVAGIFDEPFADSSAVPTYLLAQLCGSTSRSPFPATEATSCSPATPATHSSSGSAAGSIGCPTGSCGRPALCCVSGPNRSRGADSSN